MKRIITVLAVAALMAVMMVAIAAPAMARNLPPPAGAGCAGTETAHNKVPKNGHTEAAHVNIPRCD